MTELHSAIVEVVSKSLNIPSTDVTDQLAAGDVPSWDSLGHVVLLQALEERFGLTFDIDDALSIESVSDMVRVLSKLTTSV